MTREQRLARVFVELADTLVAQFDVIDFLHTLTERCVELLGVDAAGLMLADQRGQLRVIASSAESARLVEIFELQHSEGPCLDCFHSGQQVVNVGEDQMQARWPGFAAEAAELGFRSAHALPMRLRDEVIGAINLFDPSRADASTTTTSPWVRPWPTSPRSACCRSGSAGRRTCWPSSCRWRSTAGC